MTSVEHAPDQAWAGYADMEDAEREPLMLERMRTLASLNEEERRDQLHGIVVAEYALSNEKLKPLSMSRLRALLSLDREDAQRIAGSYDAAMQLMPANAAMRRVTIVQALATEMTPEEEQQLTELLPNVFNGAGRVALSATMASQGFGARGGTAEKSSKKPFWAFWKK